MIIKLRDYKRSKKLIIKQYNDQGLARVLEQCCYTFVPIIVVYAFLQQEYGGFEDKIASISKFYGYTGIDYEM